MRFAVIAGLLVGAFVLLLLASVDERLPCNSEGEVRYVGKRMYECQRTTMDGLRWTWKW